MSREDKVIEHDGYDGNEIDDEDAEEFSNELEKLKTKLDQDDSRSASPVNGSPPTSVKISVTESSPTHLPVESMTQQPEKAKDLGNTNTDDIIKQLVSNLGNGPAKLLKPPESKPGAVCFSYPNTDLTHLDVKEAVEKYLQQSQPDILIVKIEFQPRCKLMLPPDKVDTNICRWVITVDTDWGRLNNREFSIRDISIVLKNYDEIVALEFRQFGRMAQIKNLVNKK